MPPMAGLIAAFETKISKPLYSSTIYQKKLKSEFFLKKIQTYKLC